MENQPGLRFICPKHDAVMEIVYQITALSRSIAENKSEVIKLEGQLEALQPWLGLDLPMRFKGTGQTRAFLSAPCRAAWTWKLF